MCPADNNCPFVLSNPSGERRELEERPRGAHDDDDDDGQAATTTTSFDARGGEGGENVPGGRIWYEPRHCRGGGMQGGRPTIATTTTTTTETETTETATTETATTETETETADVVATIRAR